MLTARLSPLGGTGTSGPAGKWRRLQAAWRQASLQCRRRPAGKKPFLHTGQGRNVTPSLRDGCSASGTGPAPRPGWAVAGFAHAERLPVGHDDDAVVQQPVQQRHGRGLVGQEAAPVLERPMAGYGECPALVGGGDEAEQQLGAGVVEGREAELVKLWGHRHSLTYANPATMPIWREQLVGNSLAGRASGARTGPGCRHSPSTG